MERESSHYGGSNVGGGTKIVTRKVGSTPVPYSGDGNTVAVPKQEEWTTSRKVVNHKTKQVETRVQRQIIMEDGKVIADSGPQVTTKTKEDQKKEETENTNHRNVGDIDAPPGPGYVAVPGGNQVVSEKTETHQSMREAKEENMQYHDESFKELSGLEVHRKALQAPNDLIKIDSENSPERPKGKLIHYSSKSHKINDSEEVKETSRLGRDGNVTTETTRTHHHEEFDDDELPEDNPEVKALPPAASTETTRKVEYLKDYEDGFDNFPKAMNRQNPNIRAIEKSNYNRDNSRRSYEHNEENVKNTSTTSRWLDDHFGSDESDIVETSNTRTGKNIINVSKTGRTSTPISAYSGEYHSIDRSKNVSHQQKTSKHSSPQKYTTTASYYVKDSRTPSPTNFNEYYVRPGSQFKEDASIQASLSDDDEERIVDFRNTSYSSKERNRVSDRRSETPNRPEKTFYFGDDNIERRNYRNDKHEYLKKQNTNQRNVSYAIERDSKVNETNKQHNYKQSEDWKEGGYVSANVQTRVLSTLNDKVVNDSATNENFERSFKDDTERSDVHQNLNRLMDKTWTSHSQNKNTTDSEPQPWGSIRSSPRSIEYIHPVIQDESYTGRRDPSNRQRNFDSYTSPPPLYSGNSKYSTNGVSQNKDYKYNYSSSPSPPSSPTGGTWTKSRARNISPIYRSTSPNDDFPQFSPLLSPLEIKNFTESYTNGRNFSSNQ